MSEIQNLVYAIEVGSLRKWILRGALFVIILGLSIFYFVVQFNGLKYQEAMDQAQVARQIADGKGFSTKVIRPLQLKKMEEIEGDDRLEDKIFPELVHPPVYPYLLGTLFKVTGVSFDVDIKKLRDFRTFKPEQIIIFFNLFCFIVGLFVFYYWMIRAFDEKVAVVSTLLLIFCDLLWSISISGMEMPLLFFLICLLGFCINESLLADESENLVFTSIWFGMSAVVLAGLFLTRYSMVGLLIPFIGCAFFAYHARAVTTVIALVVPLLLCVPWFVRNFDIIGNPFGLSWGYIFVQNGLPGDTFWRSYGAEGDAVVNLKMVLRAIRFGGKDILENFSALFGGVVAPALFLGSLLHIFRKVNTQYSRWFWIAGIIGVACLNAAVLKTSREDYLITLNSLIVFLPVFAGYGVAFLYVLIDRMRLSSQILQYPIIFLVCMVQVLPMCKLIRMSPLPPYAYPPYFPPIHFLTTDWLEEGEVVACDAPWATAWYSNHNSLWLPYKEDNFFKLSDFKLKVSSMMLTPYSANKKLFSEIKKGEYADWALLIKRDFSQFRLKSKNLPLPHFTIMPPPVNDDFLYLSDRVRWDWKMRN